MAAEMVVWGWGVHVPSCSLLDVVLWVLESQVVNDDGGGAIYKVLAASSKDSSRDNVIPKCPLLADSVEAVFLARRTLSPDRNPEPISSPRCPKRYRETRSGGMYGSGVPSLIGGHF
jgi:hypothetical protein